MKDSFSKPPLGLLFEASRAAAIIADAEATCVDANSAAIALLGLGKEQLIGHKLRDLFAAGQEAKPSTGLPYQGELRLMRGDGTILDIDSFCALDDESGLYICVLNDISVRKKTEKTLEALEEQHRKLIDNAPDPILVFQDGRIVYCNFLSLVFYGADNPEKLQRVPLEKLIHPEEREITRKEIEEVLNGGTVPSQERRHILLDGTEVPVQINAAPMLWNRRPAAHLIIHDISRRINTERALQESQWRLVRAQHLAQLGSWELDMVSNKLTWSEEVYRIFELDPREFTPTYEAFLARIHPQDREAVKTAYSKSIERGEDCYDIEHRIIRETTGEVRWVSEKCEHLRNADGKILRSIGMVLDITERKQASARQELTTGILKVLNRNTGDLQDKIREILSLLKDWMGFDAVALRLRQRDVYPYSCQIGFPDAFVRANQHLCEQSNGDGAAMPRCTCRLVLSGKTDSNRSHFSDGGSFWTNSSSKLLKCSPNWCLGNGYESIALIPVLSDSEVMGLLQLSDRRSNQLNRDYISFLEGLGGQLGLAFKRLQIQNELKAVNQSLEQQVAERTTEIRRRSEQLRMLALELTQTEQRERQRLAEILHEGLQQVLVAAKYRLALAEHAPDLKQLTNEISDLIDNAINTSRSLTAELSPPILRQGGFLAGLEWLRRWMYDKHGLRVDLSVGPFTLYLSRDRSLLLFQAVRELLYNVIKHAGVKEAQLKVDQQDGNIRVEVNDNGGGFNPAQLRTAGGTGTGFGLFSLSERIRTLGGQMVVETAPGRGTQIGLLVPAFDQTAEAVPARAEISLPHLGTEPAAAPRQEKVIHIVLVDDHIVVRQGLAGLLKREPDMEVVGEASDGRKALELAYELRPDIVLMDVNMPIMDGIEATRLIKEQVPQTRIIGLSMFDASEQAGAMRDAGADDYLTKSGPSEALLHAIRSCAKTG